MSQHEQQQPEPSLVSILIERGNVTKTWVMPKCSNVGIDTAPNGAMALYIVPQKDEHGIACYEDTETKPEGDRERPDEELVKTLSFLRLIFGSDAVDDACDWLDEQPSEPTT